MARLTTTIRLVSLYWTNRSKYLGNNRNLEGKSLMDIFEEIKEAVLSATPGEDTRNYYRNQGIAMERERIIKLLEEEFNDTWPTGVAFVETSLPNLIELIKGETK
jgi:hypothetical protein